MKILERIKQILLFVLAFILLNIANLLDSIPFTRPLLQWILRPRGFNFDNLKNADKIVVKTPTGKTKTIEDVITIKQIAEEIGTTKTGQTIFLGTDPTNPYADAVSLSFFQGNELLKTFGLLPISLYSWYQAVEWIREFKEGEYEYFLKLLALKSNS